MHSFTGRVLFEASHPRLGTLRAFQLKCWTWDKLRTSLPDGYTLFKVDLVHNNRSIDAYQALMSLTDDEVLEVGYA